MHVLFDELVYDSDVDTKIDRVVLLQMRYEDRRDGATSV